MNHGKIPLSSVKQVAAESGLADVELWNYIMQLFGSSPEVMLARGGDLTHDIHHAMSQSIRINAKRFPSMISYINENAPPAIAARVRSYVRYEPAIMADFNTFGRNIPELVLRTKHQLKALTQRLLTQGFRHIVLDSQFGNLFKDGFGTTEGHSMILIDAIVSRVDGATKASAKSALYGIKKETRLEEFTIPWFYMPEQTHILYQQDKKNVIKATTPDSTFLVQCATGISVNAICKATHLTPPRGSGVATPIQVHSIVASPHFGNHTVFIKTLTDWAQIAYVLYLNLTGTPTIFITNDEYCLALAGAVGLPYIIRTPSTKADFVEVYNFDSAVNVLSEEAAAVIRENITIGIPDVAASAIIRDFVTYSNGVVESLEQGLTPPLITAFIESRLRELRERIAGKLMQFPVGAEPPADITAYRFLQHITPLMYVSEYVRESIQAMKTAYSKFAVDVRQSIRTDHGETSMRRVLDITLARFHADPDIVQQVFTHLNFFDVLGPQWVSMLRAFLISRGYQYLAPDRIRYRWNPAKEFLKAFSGLPKLPMQGGGGNGDGKEEEIAAVIAAQYHENITPHIPYLSTEYPSYKPSVSHDLSTRIAALTLTEPPHVQIRRILDVLDAWDADAWETNMDGPFSIAKYRLHDLAEATSQNQNTIAQELTYAILVDPDISTLLPSLEPATELPRLIAALLHLREETSTIHNNRSQSRKHNTADRRRRRSRKRK